MDFDFNADQKLFKDQVRRALAAACPLSEVRRVLEGDDPFSRPAWAVLCELGAPAAAIPEVYGGLGLGYYELCLAAEEAGRALAPTPLATSVFVGAEILLAGGEEDQKRCWLPRLAGGQIIAGFGDTFLAGPPRLRDGKLSGVCTPLAEAMGADIAFLLSDEDGQPTLVLVDLAQGEIQRRKTSSVDPARDVGELTFRDAVAERIGRRGDGVAILERVKQRAAILTAFEQLGGADRALEMARDFALQRKAFGRQIGGYQAIKHKLANVYIANEVARAHAYYGAWALSTEAPDLALAAAAARVSATEAFSHAAQENIQTHGGMGFTWEADCQLFYRRARLLALQLGGVLDWKERLTAALDQSNSL